MIIITAYYYDLVTTNGTLLSSHAVNLQMMGVNFPWRSLIILKEGSVDLQRGLGEVESYEHNEHYHLSIPAYNTQGYWERSEKTARHHLNRSDHYRIIWQGLSLNSLGRVQSEENHYQGKGYVEKLTLILDRMNAPFTQFRWGRFISEDCHYYSVWIMIDGPNPRTLIIDPEGTYELGDIDWNELHYNNQIIRCSNHQPILETLLSDHFPPWIRAMFPGNLVLGTKKKWLANGEMIDKNGQRYEGWIVEESFQWDQ